MINSNAEFTNNKIVDLSISNFVDGEMYITEDPTCKTGGKWERFSNFKKWELSTENTKVSVFVKFRESASESSNNGATSSSETKCFGDSIIHDNIPPQILVSRPVGNYLKSEGFNLELKASDNLSGIGGVNCTSSAGLQSACNMGNRVSSLSDGSYGIAVSVFDKAGNVSSVVNDSFVVDSLPPAADFVMTPSKLTSSKKAKFQFKGTDLTSGIDHFECLQGETQWTTCSDTLEFEAAEGKNLLKLRAVDRSGNYSESISYDWETDSKAPQLSFSKTPNIWSNQANAIFEFSGTDDGRAISKFECKTDQGNYAACQSPFELKNLTEKEYVVEVRGMDEAGNYSQAISFKWTVDLTPPTLTISIKPQQKTTDPNAFFSFQGVDSSSGLKEVYCRLGGNELSNCPTLNSYSLITQSSGKYEAEFIAVDNAGNRSESQKVSWTFDATKPILDIKSGPSNPTNIKLAQFEFDSSDDLKVISKVECNIDGGEFLPCSSPYTVNDLADGEHIFQARAFDDVGNQSEVKVWQWFLDSAGPSIAVSEQPSSSVLFGAEVKITYLVSEVSGVGISQVRCGFSGLLADCPETQSLSFSNLEAGSYEYQIEAVDKLNNVSLAKVIFNVERETRKISQDINVNSNNMADILIVIDNSGSMRTEQANMAIRFGSFIDKLVGLNWQLGIITTDLTTPGYYDEDECELADCKTYTDGLLVPLKKSNYSFFGGSILNSTMDINNVKSIFGYTIQQGAMGSSFEQGIGATTRAIERATMSTVKVENAQNQMFFRSNSVLSVIVVSDADETPMGVAASKNNPDKLIELIQTKWPGKPFLFHSIVVKSGDASCLSIDGNESYGLTYESLSRKTGGVIGSVCESNYGNQLSAVGQAVVDQIRSISLECMPLDLNNDGLPDIKIINSSGSNFNDFTIQGLTLTLSSNLPAGTNKVEYTCVVP